MSPLTLGNVFLHARRGAVVPTGPTCDAGLATGAPLTNGVDTYDDLCGWADYAALVADDAAGYDPDSYSWIAGHKYGFDSLVEWKYGSPVPGAGLVEDPTAWNGYRVLRLYYLGDAGWSQDGYYAGNVARGPGWPGGAAATDFWTRAFVRPSAAYATHNACNIYLNRFGSDACSIAFGGDLAHATAYLSGWDHYGTATNAGSLPVVTNMAGGGYTQFDASGLTVTDGASWWEFIVRVSLSGTTTPRATYRALLFKRGTGPRSARVGGALIDWTCACDLDPASYADRGDWYLNLPSRSGTSGGAAAVVDIGAWESRIGANPFGV